MARLEKAPGLLKLYKANIEGVYQRRREQGSRPPLGAAGEGKYCIPHPAFIIFTPLLAPAAGFHGSRSLSYRDDLPLLAEAPLCMRDVGRGGGGSITICASQVEEGEQKGPGRREGAAGAPAGAAARLPCVTRAGTTNPRSVSS